MYTLVVEFHSLFYVSFGCVSLDFVSQFFPHNFVPHGFVSACFFRMILFHLILFRLILLHLVLFHSISFRLVSMSHKYNETYCFTKRRQTRQLKLKNFNYRKIYQMSKTHRSKSTTSH